MCDELPFCQASENNKHAILKHLSTIFAQSTRVLEIGSGYGQHAVFFANALPHLIWMTADQREYHESINAWLAQQPAPNLCQPIELVFPQAKWPDNDIDGVYTANTAHIMQASEVEAMMTLINNSLPTDGIFCQYGPFIIDGEFSTESNREFHERLIDGGYGGYRDLDELKAWAPNMILDEVHQMPANNLLLHWVKR